jgi:ABC-2 type transport system ATP-binding protein
MGLRKALAGAGSGKLRRRVPRLTRQRAIAAGAVLAILAGLVVWGAWPQARNWRAEARTLTVRTGPDGATAIPLDTTIYLPRGASAADPVPAVLLAHGFGGSKDSVREQAEDLVRDGYAVLTWTAQGFGDSGGQIHLNSPDYEVRDAQQLLDWLATRPEVRKDGAGDPRVGVVGASYGGALALLLAAYDHRVDATVPMITWNDLERVFLPGGVFAKGWAGWFFGGSASDDSPECGRFAADVCRAYQQVATTGQVNVATRDLLRRSSPSSVLDRIEAPTLLIQGEADSLFPLTEADANARGIAANGTPVRVAWYTGGHDGGSGPPSDQDRITSLTADWLAAWVKREGRADASFTWSRITGLDAANQGLEAGAYSVADYPGLAGTARSVVRLAGGPRQIANPPNGTPAGISSLPGAGARAAAVGRLATDIPGQHAEFVSAPLDEPVEVVGAPTVTIRAASPTGAAVLFVKLYDVDTDGTSTLPNGLVAPIRLAGLPGTVEQAAPVSVRLPAIVHRFEPGHRFRLVVATSDQAYATPAAPALYTVALDGTGLTLPTVDGRPIASPEAVWRWVLAGLVAAVATAAVVVVLVARRRRLPDPDPSYADTPLVVRGLRKAYADDFVAVSRVDFTVQRGQVVGLLGPNGAGKTTTLRVLLGLTRPTAGEVLVFGHRLVPGAPVLSRLGALVEGPGFLPHLSGLDNLRGYWRATGRPVAEARLDEALELAGLGDAVHRKVRTYSHGMKQRLAIAQAMLGLPELLVLDEPTDGLDPPQIAEMRRILKRYAGEGSGVDGKKRAVLVSSHLLAEVEQTCTHVVVVHKGEVVADGPVGEIVGDSPTVVLDVSDRAAASAVLSTMDGVTVVPDGERGLVANLNGTPRARVVEALVRAGVGVDRVVPRRRLEDAFLALVGSDTRGSGDR